MFGLGMISHEWTDVNVNSRPYDVTAERTLLLALVRGRDGGVLPWQDAPTLQVVLRRIKGKRENVFQRALTKQISGAVSCLSSPTCAASRSLCAATM